MFKVIIVDDFIVDREELKSIVNSFQDIGVEIVGDCENGVQALVMVKDLLPDIIISDIEMPFIDGFQLAKEIKRDFPQIKIIFCTQYRYFDYVKQAFYLDGYGYVLKPVIPEELKECIVNVTDKIRGELVNVRQFQDIKALLEENRPILSENLIRGLIYGTFRKEDDIWGKINYLSMKIEKGIFILACAETDSFDKITENMTIDQKQIFSLRIHEKIKSVIGFTKKGLFCRLDEAHCIFIFNFAEDSMVEEYIHDIKLNCEKVVQEFRKTDISITIAISGPTKFINGLDKLYEQSCYIMKHKFLLGKGKVLLNEDVPSSSSRILVNLNEIQKELGFLINSGTREEISCYIERIYNNFSKNNGEQFYKNISLYIVLCVQMILNEHGDEMKAIFGEDRMIWEKLLEFDTILDIRNWLINIICSANEFLSAKALKKGKAVSEEVKHYIERNFHLDISLDVIAKDLFYSANYLNYIFKQNMGESIYAYVGKYRIERAKELLANSRLRLCEVAEQTGYKQTAYFISVFKKYTRMTPKEFRERCVYE